MNCQPLQQGATVGSDLRQHFTIPYLEILITHQCNLHCDGCANYGNYGLKERMSFEENREYLRLWARRITPKEFRILGGEPTIHPNLLDYVRLAHELWPESRRIMTTNGAFFDRHENFLETMISTNTVLLLSFHSNDPKYLEWITPILTQLKKWAQLGLNVHYGDYRQFLRMHRGVGTAMRPFDDNDPVQSWSHCISRPCKNFARGRLWKCPEMVGLRSVLRKFGLENSPEWAPYVGYNGIGLDASDEELIRFFNAGPEPICSMCPKAPQLYAKDIYNTNLKRNSERAEWEGEPINLQQFIDSIPAQ